jgi:tetratricopeptide (TPR) repeat protein
MKNILLMLTIAAILLSCSEENKTDEKLLWEYYKGFTYKPELFDSLSNLANEPATKLFFSGLKCFEKYSQDEIVVCYDSAFDIFTSLQRQFPENYLGHLGMGLLMTEKGMIVGEQIYFDSSVVYYERAHRANPSNAAIYYYRGRNEYNRNKNLVNENAIRFLDTATQLKPDFFKAAERSARFLSHYLDLATVSASKNPLYADVTSNDLEQKFNATFPQAKDRVRYLFAQSVAIDPSWYETYQDIANAHQVYSAKERLDFLKTGITIAQKKKSKDSLRLIKSLASLYFYDLNDYEKARSEYGSWISKQGSATDYINLAWCQHFLKQSEAVPFLMQEAISKDKSGMAHFEYGLFFKETGRFQEALRELDEALGMQGKNAADVPIWQVERAKILAILGRQTETKQILTEVNKTDQASEGSQKAGVLTQALLKK